MLRYLGFGVLITLLLLLIIMHKSEKARNRKGKEGFEFRSSLFYVDIENTGKEIMFSYLMFGAIFLMIVWKVIFLINQEVEYYKKFLEEINSVEGIVLAFFAIVVSVIIFSATLGPKEYYLSITRSEVNRQFGIHMVFYIMSIGSFISVICVLFLQKEELCSDRDHALFSLYQICCLVICIFGVYGLIIIGMLTVGRSKMELRSLDKLHRKFWNNSTLRLLNQTEDVIYVNSGYLMKKYINLKYVKKDMLSGIKEIKYRRDVETDEKWQKYAVRRITVFVAVMALFSVVPMAVVNDIFGIFLTVLILLSCLVCLHSKRYRGKFRSYIVWLFLDNQGFMVKNMDKERKDKFIGTVGPICNKSGKKYIHSICNMMALYYIVCSCCKKKKVNMISDSFDDMIEYIKMYEEGREGFSRALLYLPVFVCSYYYFINFKQKEFPESIIKSYASFKLTKEESKRFFITLNSFIVYAARLRPSSMDREVAKSGEWKDTYYERYIENNGFSQLFEGMKL